jgi:hypothetical protein
MTPQRRTGLQGVAGENPCLPTHPNLAAHNATYAVSQLRQNVARSALL